MDVHLFPKQYQAWEYLSEDNDVVTEVLYGGGARGGNRPLAVYGRFSVESSSPAVSGWSAVRN